MFPPRYDKAVSLSPGTVEHETTSLSFVFFCAGVFYEFSSSFALTRCPRLSLCLGASSGTPSKNHHSVACGLAGSEVGDHG